MSLWRLYYHIVWATKNRHPYLTLERERQLYAYIVTKAKSLNTIVHAIGGIEDHVHLVVSIPPNVSISDFVKKIKGSSSHYFNQVFGNSPKFAWQEGYGVFSLGRKQLESAVDYVRNQKENHRQRTLLALLEETGETDNPPPIEGIEPTSRSRISFADGF